MKTSFVTSFGYPNVLESCPELTKIVNEKMQALLKLQKNPLPKYSYPDEVVTAAMVQRYSKYGIPFQVRQDECVLIRSLDAQKASGKAIYGAGLLLSRKKAEERAAAERWILSEREKAIVNML